MTNETKTLHRYEQHFLDGAMANFMNYYRGQLNYGSKTPELLPGPAADNVRAALAAWIVEGRRKQRVSLPVIVGHVFCRGAGTFATITEVGHDLYLNDSLGRLWVASVKHLQSEINRLYRHLEVEMDGLHLAFAALRSNEVARQAEAAVA